MLLPFHYFSWSTHAAGHLFPQHRSPFGLHGDTVASALLAIHVEQTHYKQLHKQTLLMISDNVNRKSSLYKFQQLKLFKHYIWLLVYQAVSSQTTVSDECRCMVAAPLLCKLHWLCCPHLHCLHGTVLWNTSIHNGNYVLLSKSVLIISCS